MWIWLLAVSARAEVPLPSYRDALVHEAWVEANELLEAGAPEEAAAKAQWFQANVTADGGLEYLVGLSWRLRGDPLRAEKHYEAALALDPSLIEAWYDVGEIQLARGDLAAAKRSFGEVATRGATGDKGWLGPWRLAEIAAHEHDPDTFEAQLRIALERGFSFRIIEGAPNWKGFYADPAMRDSVEKMITVYGTPSTLESLAP